MNLLWLPHAPWHRPQRAHLFAETLAHRHNVWVADWDGYFVRLSDFFSRRYALNLVPRRWRQGGVSVEHVPRVAPALFSRQLRDLNDRLYRGSLARLLAREQIDVVVGCFAAPVPEGVPTVADVFDDNVGMWLAYGLNKAYAAEIAAREGAWISQSRVTVTVSSVLRDRVRETHPRAEVVHIANGVDLSRYVPGRQEARATLGLSQATKYVGNVGALDNRGEADRVLAAAKHLHRRPGVEVLVVGEGAALPYLKRAIAQQGLTNVRLVGFVAGDRLLKYFQALDVGLCPYESTPADHARVPLRLLHYSAVGATVVCSRLEEVTRMNFENVLLCEDDADSFAQRVSDALDARPRLPGEIGEYDIKQLVKRYETVLAATRSEASRQGAAWF